MTLYLTLVLDLFSRQVVDWSMKSHMTTDNELARCLENPGRFTDAKASALKLVRVRIGIGR
jgi:transposase InsO family protein